MALAKNTLMYGLRHILSELIGHSRTAVTSPGRPR